MTSLIHLFFDPTHVLKCCYNNFFTRKLLKCPDFDGENVEANFEHIKTLYKMEFGKSPKYAYKLTDKVISPNGIEKTSVKLADALFHPSTINGVRVYGEKSNPESNPEFLKTAHFLQIIRNWWDSINVKSKGVCFQKRDSNKDEININNPPKKTEKYQAIVDWLSEWQVNCKENKMKRNGLSDETFLTFKQTT